MNNRECNFKLKSKGHQVPEGFKDFVDHEFKPAIAKLNSRLDKHDEMFKTHGGIK